MFTGDFPAPFSGSTEKKSPHPWLAGSAATPPLAPLPSFPEFPATGARSFAGSWPSPLPVTAAAPEPFERPRPAPMVFETSAAAFQSAPFAEKVEPRPAPPPAPDFNDDDLREAFAPIIEQAVRNAVYAKENGIDTYLEPMLRATIRRALAEYAPASRPFHAPGAMDRFLWRLQALFTSRTYDDIVFEKTHRFQIEEVFLLDARTLALVSFASCDPARHASARRIESTVQRLALQLRDENGEIRTEFKLPGGRTIIARKGTHIALMAVLRGQPNELVLADLEFSLRRIEDTFRDRFKPDGGPMLHVLQPYLEDCLLIQAPASAA